MPLVLVTPPSVEPVSVADARDRLGLGTEISDTAVAALIMASRQKIEKKYGVAMINQAWCLQLDHFPGCGVYPIETGFVPSDYYRSFHRPEYGTRLSRSEIAIDLTPLGQNAITSIAYTDSDGTPQALDPSVYNLVLGGLTSRVALANAETWPSAAFMAGAVKVNFTAGFGTDDTSVPETMKTAIILMVSHLRSLTAQNLFLSLDSVEGVGEQRFIVPTGATDVIDLVVSSLLQDYVRPSL